jgi:threonine/homoserine/homoserine lactone efflux protein
MSVVLLCIIAAAFGFVGSMPLAGPIAVLVVSRAAQKEYGAAFRIGLGAALAEGIYAFLAFWGFATFLARHPVVLPISHGVTAVILLGLGAYFLLLWRHRDTGRRSKERERRGKFLLGFTISIINPTFLATWSAATTLLYSKQVVDMQGWMAVPFGVSAMLGVIGWWVVLLWLLKRFGDRFPESALTKVVRGMGLVLIGVGVWSAGELALYLTGHGHGQGL